MSGALIQANSIQPHEPAAARSFSWSVPETSCCVLVFAAALFNLVDLSGDRELNVPNPQVMLKILLGACCGLFGLYGTFKWPRVFYALMSLPTGIFLLMGIIFLVSIPFSVDPIATIVATLLYWAMLLFTLSAMHVLGTTRMLHAIAAGFFSFVIGSWIAVLVFPAFGVFREVIDLEQVQLRMGGLTHPNTLGIICALLSLMIIYFGVHERVRWRFLAVPLLLSLVALVLSLSRTSMLAFLLSAIFVNRRILRHKHLYPLVGMGLMAFMLALFVASLNSDLTRFFGEFLLGFSKSGSLEELTTATGRVEIWKFTIEQIAEAPWFGKGLATSKIVMADYSGHPHNEWLNFFYCGGIFCGLLLIVLTAYLVWRVFAKPRPAVDGIVMFILFSGLAERVVLTPVPAGPLMLLIFATAWPLFTAANNTELKLPETAG